VLVSRWTLGFRLGELVSRWRFRLGELVPVRVYRLSLHSACYASGWLMASHPQNPSVRIATNAGIGVKWHISDSIVFVTLCASKIKDAI
jgi:hypothetical protein